VKNAEIFQSGENIKIFQRFFTSEEKYKDFPKWGKIQRFFKVVRNAKISQNGFIVMGNRPKNGKSLKVGRNARISQKWFHCYGQPAQMEDEKCFERGLIIMGDLPGQEDKMSKKDDMIGLDGEQGLKSALERR
jgi:hypothetical protein